MEKALPEGWKMLMLGDKSIVDIIDGDRGGNYPKKTQFQRQGHCLFLNTSNVTKGYFNFKRCDFISKERDEKLGKGKAKRFDVVLTTRGTLGNSILYDESIPYENMRINSGMVLLRSSHKKLLPIFLLKMISSDFFTQQIKKFTSGSAQPQLPIRTLSKFQIPLPPIPTQHKIVEILQEADRLRKLRREADEKMKDLIPALFVKMFGDPLRNDKGWKKKPLNKLGSLDRGVSKHRPRNAPELLGGKYPLIQTGDVSNAGTYITKFTQTYSEKGFKQSKLWPAGTLCITIAANIAKTGILTFDACFPDSVVGFTTDKNESHVLYVHYLFSFFQRILEKNSPQAAQKNINLGILRNLQVPRPPLPLQQEFAERVQEIEAEKERQAKSRAKLDDLFNGLMQKAFKGELVA